LKERKRRKGERVPSLPPTPYEPHPPLSLPKRERGKRKKECKGIKVSQNPNSLQKCI